MPLLLAGTRNASVLDMLPCYEIILDMLPCYEIKQRELQNPLKTQQGLAHCALHQEAVR